MEREGATIEAVSSSDWGHFVDAVVSAVGEAGREDLILGSDEEGAAEKELVSGGKNKVMKTEDSN